MILKIEELNYNLFRDGLINGDLTIECNNGSIKTYKAVVKQYKCYEYFKQRINCSYECIKYILEWLFIRKYRNSFYDFHDEDIVEKTICIKMELYTVRENEIYRQDFDLINEMYNISYKLGLYGLTRVIENHIMSFEYKTKVKILRYLMELRCILGSNIISMMITKNEINMEKLMMILFNNGKNSGNIKCICRDGTLNIHGYILAESVPILFDYIKNSILKMNSVSVEEAINIFKYIYAEDETNFMKNKYIMSIIKN